MKCRHCGDPIIKTDSGWKHDFGDRLYYQCQRNVPYGPKAEPPDA